MECYPECMKCSTAGFPHHHPVAKGNQQTETHHQAPPFIFPNPPSSFFCADPKPIPSSPPPSLPPGELGLREAELRHGQRRGARHHGGRQQMVRGDPKRHVGREDAARDRGEARGHHLKKTHTKKKRGKTGKRAKGNMSHLLKARYQNGPPRTMLQELRRISAASCSWDCPLPSSNRVLTMALMGFPQTRGKKTHGKPESEQKVGLAKADR